MLNYLVILELLDLGIENFMVEKREKEEEVDRIWKEGEYSSPGHLLAPLLAPPRHWRELKRWHTSRWR